MAKADKHSQVPIADTGHSAEVTLEERTQYLLQAVGQEAGFLEQWIVHYLAELLERASDRKATRRTRSEARAEIARVIPALWEQQIARETLHVRQKVEYWLRRTDKLDHPEAQQLLRPMLADPGRVLGLAESERAELFRSLHTLAELVTRLWSMIASAERTSHEVASQAIQRFLRRDEEVQGLQVEISRVVPDFAALDLTNSEAVGKIAVQTLLALSQTQLTLLKYVSDDMPSPRKKRGRRRPRDRGASPREGDNSC